jgi:hypothetical protein
MGGPQGRSGQVRKTSPPSGFDPRDRPGGSQSLYRLRYPAYLDLSIEWEAVSPKEKEILLSSLNKMNINCNTPNTNVWIQLTALREMVGVKKSGEVCCRTKSYDIYECKK